MAFRIQVYCSLVDIDLIKSIIIYPWIWFTHVYHYYIKMSEGRNCLFKKDTGTVHYWTNFFRGVCDLTIHLALEVAGAQFDSLVMHYKLSFLEWTSSFVWQKNKHIVICIIKLHNYWLLSMQFYSKYNYPLLLALFYFVYCCLSWVVLRFKHSGMQLRCDIKYKKLSWSLHEVTFYCGYEFCKMLQVYVSENKLYTSRQSTFINPCYSIIC